jgi:hypothetical protein
MNGFRCPFACGHRSSGSRFGPSQNPPAPRGGVGRCPHPKFSAPKISPTGGAEISPPAPRRRPAGPLEGSATRKLMNTYLGEGGASPPGVPELQGKIGRTATGRKFAPIYTVPTPFGKKLARNSPRGIPVLLLLQGVPPHNFQMDRIFAKIWHFFRKIVGA